MPLAPSTEAASGPSQLEQHQDTLDEYDHLAKTLRTSLLRPSQGVAWLAVGHAPDEGAATVKEPVVELAKDLPDLVPSYANSAPSEEEDFEMEEEFGAHAFPPGECQSPTPSGFPAGSPSASFTSASLPARKNSLARFASFEGDPALVDNHDPFAELRATLGIAQDKGRELAEEEMSNWEHQQQTLSRLHDASW